MKINTPEEQNKILKKYFGITIKIPKKLPKVNPEADGVFLIPKWDTIGNDYNNAVIKVLEALKKDRPCYDWRKGKWTKEYLRQRTPRVIPEIVSAQLGKKYKGKSVSDVRTIATSETLLGIYEMGIIILTNPGVLARYKDLWIDCGGDEYSYNGDGVFSQAPLFSFDDDRVEFVTHGVGFAGESDGTASCFDSQLNLESSPLETFDSLTLESAVKICKDNGLKVIKEM